MLAPSDSAPTTPDEPSSAPSFIADRYHALLYTMDQGFCTLEVLFDETGQQAVDYRYLEVNPMFAQQSGMPADAVGKTVRELMPDIEQFWFDTFGQVVRTGVAVRLEHHVPQLGRWFDVHAFPMGAPEAQQVAVLFTDITARKQAEETLRHAAEAETFRLQLADALGPLTNPVTIQAAVTHLARLHFKADRCYYCEIEEGQVIIRQDASAEGLPSVAGTYQLADFALLQAAIAAGQPFIVHDVRQDASVDEALRQLCVQLQVISYLNIPVIKNGQPAGELCLVQSQPRDWTDADVALAAEAAERTWVAVERARAEDAIAASEAKYRTLFNSIDEGVATMELILDDEGRATDWVYLEHNPALTRLTGLSQNIVGEKASHIYQNLEPFWMETFSRVVREGVSERFEYSVAELGKRWFEVYAARVGGAGSRQLVIVCNNITERKQQERQQAFLLQLADTLRTHADAGTVEEAISRLTLDHFGVERCYFASIEDQAAVIRHDATLAGISSVAGVYPLSSFPLYQQVLDGGRPLVIENTAVTEFMEADLRALCLSLGIVSLINVPIIKRGVAVGILCLVQSTPRAWTAQETALAEETGERLWAALSRARAEEALRVSEQRLRTLIENLPGAAVFVVNRELRYQEAQGEALRAAGFESADLLGRTVSEALPPAQAAQHLPHYQQALAGQPFAIEHEAHGHAYISRGAPLFGPTGQVEAVLVVSYDLTDRKRAEEALRASEEQLRLFVMASSDALYRVDANWQRMLRLDGNGFLADSTAPRTNWLETYIPPVDQAVVGAAIEEAIASQRFFELEHHVVRADGSVGWTFSRAVPLLNEHGELVEWFGTATDITARKQAEELLQKSEQQLAELNAHLEQQVAERTRELRDSRDLVQSAFDTNLIAMSVLHAVRDEAGEVQDFQIRLANKELERATGRTDLVGKYYAQEYPGIKQAGIYALILRALATGEPQGAEYYYEYEGFNRWYSCLFVRLDDGVVATNLDITERKLAEQKSLRNLHLLEQAEAVAGLGSWDYDLLTKEFLWSNGMYQLFGLPPGQPVGPSIYLQFALAEDQPQAEQLVARITSGTDSFEQTLRLRVGEQVRTLRIKAVGLRNEAGQPVRVLGVDLDISELLRLEADNLRLRLSQQQDLFEAVQQAQEEERRRLSESLHNGIGQILYATRLQLDRLPEGPELPARREAARLLGEAIRQTRTLSHELTPALLEEFGLEKTLQSICGTLNTPGLRWHCHLVFEEGPPLPLSLQLVVYRLAQELAQNVLKHADATEATLEVEVLSAWIVLRVEDNGRGFDPAHTNDGLGLRSLRGRVALLNGSVHLSTAPGQGTQYQVRLPLSPFT